MAAPTLPAFVGSSDAEDGEARRAPVRLAGIVGALASALWFAAFFLPWIEIPPSERTRIPAALEPSIESMARRQPEHAERYRILVRQIVEEGHLSGLDLYHYARTALALNETLIGTEPGPHALERPWVVQRALRLAGLLLAVLPLGAALVALWLLAHAFRRVASPVLSALLVFGTTGLAVAVAWFRFAETLTSGVRTGYGLELVLGAAVAQACAGLFGVTTKTWWRVYLVAILGLGTLAFAASRFIAGGAVP